MAQVENVEGCALPPLLLNAFVVVGLLFSYTMQGVSQEKLNVEFGFKEPFAATFIQFFANTFFSIPVLFSIFITKKRSLHSPVQLYFITSFTQLLTKFFLNLAATRLTYSTVVLFRSCKLIVVVLVNLVFKKQKPTFWVILSVTLLVGGLIGVSLADHKVHNQFDIIGVIAAILALFCDVYSASQEETMLKEYNSSINEVAGLVYGIGTIEIGIVALMFNSFNSIVTAVQRDPMSIPWMVIFGLSGSSGIRVQYKALELWGILQTVIVTTMRKVLAVLFSNFLFKNKKFTAMHLISCIMLIVGFTINYWQKIKVSKAKNNDLDAPRKETDNDPLLDNHDQSDASLDVENIEEEEIEIQQTKKHDENIVFDNVSSASKSDTIDVNNNREDQK